MEDVEGQFTSLLGAEGLFRLVIGTEGLYRAHTGLERLLIAVSVTWEQVVLGTALIPLGTLKGGLRACKL